MNIIFIQTDQQRRDFLPCYGNSTVHTPNIDRLASEGAVFDNAFTPSPICSPARASLLTGRYPSRHGILRNPESGCPSGYDFNGDYPYYSHSLNKQGYTCQHIGKWHIGTELTAEMSGMHGVHYPKYGFPDNHPHYLDYLEKTGVSGFVLEHETFGQFGDGTQGPLLSAEQKGGIKASVPYYLAEQTLDAIRASAQEERKFFISCNFWGPHMPYILPEEYMHIYDPAEIEKPASFEDTLTAKPNVQADMKRYWGIQDFDWDDWAKLSAACCGYISLIDSQLGRILGLLEELGLSDETAIFFSTDHGGMVGSHGLCDKGPHLYDEVCRIPLIASVPGTKGRRINSYVYNMDLMPTFIECSGGEVPEGIDGQSLLPLLWGEKEKVRDEIVYIEFYGHQIPVVQKLLRTDTWKYIFNGQERDEYYDIEKGPAELVNDIDNPAYSENIRSARQLMNKKLKDLNDPILRYFENTRMH